MGGFSFRTCGWMKDEIHGSNSKCAKVHGISMNSPVCPTYASDRDSDGLFVNARLGSKMGSLSRRVFTRARASSCY